MDCADESSRGGALAGAVLRGVAVPRRRLAQPSAPLSVPPPGPAALEQIPILKDAGLEQRLDQQVPLDTPFVDENGRDVTLGDYFGKRPVVLALVYYECPMLCTQVLNGLVGSLEALTFNAGQEFDVVAVSFDAGETPAMAAAKRAAYLKRYGRPGTESGVHFLTGREERHPARHRCGRLPLQVRPGDRSVRAPRGDHGAHA